MAGSNQKKENIPLGKVIRDARGDMPLTELASKIVTSSTTSLNVGYLSHIESGKQVPSVEILDQLSNILDIPIQTLYDLKAQQVLTDVFAASTLNKPIKISATVYPKKIINPTISANSKATYKKNKYDVMEINPS